MRADDRFHGYECTGHGGVGSAAAHHDYRDRVYVQRGDARLMADGDSGIVNSMRRSNNFQYSSVTDAFFSSLQTE